MQICTPLSPSLEIFCPVMIKVKYMYTTTRACTQLSWVFSKGESKHVNPYTNTTKIHNLFERISSWWLLNQENGFQRRRRLRRAYAFCAISSGSRCSLLNLKFWSGWRLRPKKPRHLRTAKFTKKVISAASSWNCIMNDSCGSSHVRTDTQTKI